MEGAKVPFCRCESTPVVFKNLFEKKRSEFVDYKRENCSVAY